jgi:hypothetical protein
VKLTLLEDFLQKCAWVNIPLFSHPPKKPLRSSGKKTPTMRYFFFTLSCVFIFATSHGQTLKSPTSGKQSKVVDDNMLFSYRQVHPYLLVRNSDPSKTAEENSSVQLIRFVQQQIKYPKESCVEGVSIVSFIIKVDGLIDASSIKCIRDIGGGTAQELERVVHLMATLGWRWTPGTFMGEAKAVHYNLPIRFRLE